MHPVLFRIPLPDWSVPLFPALLTIAALGAALAAFGQSRKVRDLFVIGLFVTVGSGVAAFQRRGDVLVLSELPIFSYGAMLCVSLVVGWYLTMGLAARDGLDPTVAANGFIVTAICSLLGARLLYVVTSPSEQTVGDLVAFGRGGLHAYGGFVAGFLGAWAFFRRQSTSVLSWADVAAPGVASGLVLGRLGCYLFGCDFGKPLGAGAPEWLRTLGTFPRWSKVPASVGEGSPAWIEHVNHRGLSLEGPTSLPVHPTQIYEALAGVALLAMVVVLRQRRSFRGQAFLALTFGYGVLRFLIEVLRGDRERGFLGPWLEAWVSVPIGLSILAAAFAYGPARSIGKVHVRRIAQALSFGPAVLAYFLLKAGAANAQPIQLTVSQWLGVGTAVAAALTWASLPTARVEPAAVTP